MWDLLQQGPGGAGLFEDLAEVNVLLPDLLDFPTPSMVKEPDGDGARVALLRDVVPRQPLPLERGVMMPPTLLIDDAPVHDGSINPLGVPHTRLGAETEDAFGVVREPELLRLDRRPRRQ